MPNNIRNLGEAIVARRRPNPLRERIIAKAPIEQKTVKSAGRVLEILEYFDDLQRQSTVMEIADALGYPQSSTSALLRSLVGMGYLNYDAHARSYITSTRVALLGSWVNSQFFAEGSLNSLSRNSDLLGQSVAIRVNLGGGR